MVLEIRAHSARLGEPFDGFGDPISAGLRLLALVDPPRVLIAMCEGQFLVRGLGGWVLGEGLGELRRHDDNPFLVVLDEFDLHLIAHPDPEPSQQVLPEAQIALASIDREPGAILDAIDMRNYRGPLAAERCGDIFGHCNDVAALSC
jgi:hypothetical protein